MKIMQDEIFGPILPVVSYKKNEDVTELLNSFPSPLALYIMSNNKNNTQYFLIILLLEEHVSMNLCLLL